MNTVFEFAFISLYLSISSPQKKIGIRLLFRDRRLHFFLKFVNSTCGSAYFQFLLFLVGGLWSKSLAFSGHIL